MTVKTRCNLVTDYKTHRHDSSTKRSDQKLHANDFFKIDRFKMFGNCEYSVLCFKQLVYRICIRNIYGSGVFEETNTMLHLLLLPASYKSSGGFDNLRRPDMIDDVNVPVQQFYKPALYFPDKPRQGTVYLKPVTAHLHSHFREQIEQIWEVGSAA